MAQQLLVWKFGVRALLFSTVSLTHFKHVLLIMQLCCQDDIFSLYQLWLNKMN